MHSTDLAELSALLRVKLRPGDDRALMDLWNAARFYSRKECAAILGHTGPKYTLVGKEIAGVASNTATAISCAKRQDSAAVDVYTACVRICFETARFPEHVREHVVNYILAARSRSL